MRGELFIADRLQTAREFRGLTQSKLAEKVIASPAMISLLESGAKREPPPDLVDAIGTVLGFHPDFFYDPLDDLFREDECSFRHRRSTSARLKGQIRAHGTLLGIVIGKLRLHMKFPALNLPRFAATTNEDIEVAAEKSRLHWDLGLDAPILQVGRVLEHAGVIVLPHFPQTTKVDAFSRQGRTAVIFLNQGVKSTSRWIFDIGHECGHLVMHVGMETGTQETEDAANRYASAFLLPRRAFVREFRSMSWGHLFDLKRRWLVSVAAIVRRAYDLGLITAVQYRRAYQYISFKGWTKGEPYEPSFQQPELLETAFKSLGSKVSLTAQTLCREVHFMPDTFKQVTGVAVPPPPVARKAEVLSFPNSEGD